MARQGDPAPEPQHSIRRASEPDGHDADVRSQLLDAALALMTERPWERLSARAVAEHAGVDPTLVTYYFGGRAGLVAAAAAKAAVVIRGRVQLGYSEEPEFERAIQRAVRDGVAAMGDAPMLARLYVSELLLRDNDRIHELLYELTADYYGEIEQVVDEAAVHGRLRDVDRGVLLYTIAALTVFPFFLDPMTRRRGRVARADGLESFSADMVNLVLHGAAAVGGTRAAPARPRPHADAPSHADLVDAALVMLRDDPQASVTPASVAAFVGIEPQAVVSRFADLDADSLAVAVARAAVQQLAPSPSHARSRGRPTAQNPALERDLAIAARKLISTEDRRFSASAVAAAANCDPALITYYFGGRRGLLETVASDVLSNLVTRARRAYDPGLRVVDRLEAVLAEPLYALTHQPALARLLVDEFLIHGTTASDAALQSTIAPFLAVVRAAIDDGLDTGELRPAAPDALLYGVGVMPLYLAATLRVFERAHRGPQLPDDPTIIAEQILDLIVNGLLVTQP